MVGETNRLPFDLAEGEGELTGGFHTEYGSMRFAMFFLGEYINMFTVSALATTMFLGGWQAPPGIAAINDGMFNEGWWGLLWFTVKLWMFMFVFVWLRGSLPAGALRPVHALRLEVPHPGHAALGRRSSPSSAAPRTAGSAAATSTIAGRDFPVAIARRRRRHRRRSRSVGRLALGPPRRGQGGRGAPPPCPRRSTRSPGATPCRRCPASACASPSLDAPPAPSTAGSDTKEATRG